MSAPFVVIPTYWTWGASETHRPTTASFDHPTPLDGESTLPPLMDDLSKQHSRDFHVLILTGLAHPDLDSEASTHVRKLLEPYRQQLNIHLCDFSNWEKIKPRLGLTQLQSLMLHLGSYSGIRNLQLLIPHIFSAEVIIALDDDERVQPDYINRARKYMGKTSDDQKVLGLAGPYLQRDGGFLLHEPPSTGNPFLDKSRYINQTMRILHEDSGSLKPTPLTLGGNMVFHRELFTRVCFDPGITRGEDIDYLISARLQGIGWWFDTSLTILHLPPGHYDTPAYQRTREDVIRFIYEREKLRLHGYEKPEWLDPYPGALLGDDLPAQAVTALHALATPDLINKFNKPEDIPDQALAHARRNAPHYPAIQREWEALMTRIDKELSVRKELADLIKPL